MTIKARLLSCLAVLAASIAMLVVASLVGQRHSETAISQILNERVVPLGHLKKMGDLLQAGVVDAAHQVRNNDITIAEGARSVRESRARAEQHWKAFRSVNIAADERGLADRMDEALRKSRHDLDVLQGILDRGDRAALDGWESETASAVHPMTVLSQELAEHQIEGAMEVSEAALSAATVALIIIMILTAGGLVAIGLSFVVTTRKVIGPINGLATTIEGLARENSDVEVPHRDQKDEIGDIARAVDFFRSAVVEKERVRAGEAAAVQERVTSSLATALSALAGGDLTYELTGPFPADYDQLKNDFNAAVAELRSAMLNIAEATGNIHGGSGEISQASDDLSRRTEQQAASLEETAAAMTEITATVQNNSAGANEAAKLVQQAQSEATESEKVVGAAVGAMVEIEKSSREINKIISVIEKIAFQTNLLALNASVEAAHAGEAGQAFAVVANEVRALAQRSADAAQEIAELISSSTGQVANGVELVNDAGRALQRIIGQVNEIKGQVVQIAAASEQQSSALAQVNTAINEMDKVTQQNAAMVEQSTAAARALSEEATGLSQLVSRFSTGPAAADAAPMLKKAAPARARRVGVRGNNALAMQAQLAEAVDDWNEF